MILFFLLELETESLFFFVKVHNSEFAVFIFFISNLTFRMPKYAFRSKDGKKFRSLREVTTFFQENCIPLDPKCFDFSSRQNLETIKGHVQPISKPIALLQDEKV